MFLHLHREQSLSDIKGHNRPRPHRSYQKSNLISLLNEYAFLRLFWSAFHNVKSVALKS
jgi:hypothetical protein